MRDQRPRAARPLTIIAVLTAIGVAVPATLGILKGIAGLALAFALVAAAVVTARGAAAWRDRLGCAALMALGVTVALRDAAHNNPVLDALYLRSPLAAAAALAATLALGLIGGMVLARHGIPAALGWLARPDGGLRTAVAVLAALAALAALEPVLLRWGVPGWGDSIYWDRLTHLIAMGEMPAGESYYMPLYQYGSAGLLWAFGHFQQVPQLSNVAMAPLTVLFVALAAWELFRDGRLALAAAALAIAAATLGLAHLAWGRHHQVRPIPEKLAIGEVDTALAAAPDLTRTFAATWPTTPSKARIVTAGQPVRLRVELSRQHHIPSTRSLANR